jgi:Domain of unknown function (DUF5666)
MSGDYLETPPPPPPVAPENKRVGRVRIVGIALAIAVVGAAAGFVVTRAPSPAAANTTAATTKPSPSPSTRHKPSFSPRGGFGFGCGAPLAGAGIGGPSSFGGGFFGGGFCGGETGTVTKISGSTLTLRTISGTVTVTTTSKTTYSREDKTVKFGAVAVGDVVAVRGTRGSSPTATSPIAATAITIEVPSITGRVQSVSGHTVTLVTSDGQLEYVTLSGATTYHGVGKSATATVASVKAGVYIAAQGSQTSLTTFNADDVQVLGTLSFTPHSFPSHPKTAPTPAPGSASKSI